MAIPPFGERCQNLFCPLAFLEGPGGYRRNQVILIGRWLEANLFHGLFPS
jgi:hypothetical protein